MDRPTQIEVEAMYSQKNIHTVLHAGIEKELDKFLLNWSLMAYMKIEEYLGKDYYDSKNRRLIVLQQEINERGMDWLVVAIAAAALHTHNEQTIQQCVGYLQAYLPHDDAFHRAVTAGELLALCSREHGLYHIQRNGSGVPATIKIEHWPFIDRKLMDSFDWINDTCFNPPLIEKPKKVTNNHGCGYHSIREPLLLGRLTQHDEPQNLKAINLLNSIEWVLDPQVLATPERPGKPLETIEQQEQFRNMVTASNFIYALLGDQPFWFAWQYDSRGRMYTHGYHVNFQAAEYKKACLSFNKWEYLT